jgi:hypothetical protein
MIFWNIWLQWIDYIRPEKDKNEILNSFLFFSAAAAAEPSNDRRGHARGQATTKLKPAARCIHKNWN